MSKSQVGGSGDMDNDSENEGITSSFQSLAAEGDILAKQGDYRKAIDAYTKALTVRPADKTCLVTRSRCYLQLGDTQAALADADASLKEDPNFFKGIYQKAEALYAMGDFEMALVYFHRGNKLRPELNEFRLGIQKAREAIDNSIGNPRDYKLHSPGSWVGGPLDKVPANTAPGAIGGMMVGKPSSSILLDRMVGPGNLGRWAGMSPVDRGGKQPSVGAAGGPAVLGGVAAPSGIGAPAAAAAGQVGAVASEKTAKQLLGELYAEKEFLQKLYDDRDLASNPKIYGLVQDGLRYLETRTEFWRQQKPMYTRKKEQSRIAARASQARKRQEALRVQNKHRQAQHV